MNKVSLVQLVCQYCILLFVCFLGKIIGRFTTEDSYDSYFLRGYTPPFFIYTYILVSYILLIRGIVIHFLIVVTVYCRDAGSCLLYTPHYEAITLLDLATLNDSTPPFVGQNRTSS